MTTKDGKMDMRSCLKAVAGSDCIMPAGHYGDCEDVGSPTVRAAWIAKRGEGLLRHSWLCKACGGEFIIDDATSNEITELADQIEQMKKLLAEGDAICRQQLAGLLKLEAIKTAAAEYCDFIDQGRPTKGALEAYNTLRAALDGMSLKDWEEVRYNPDGTGKVIPKDWHGRR